MPTINWKVPPPIRENTNSTTPTEDNSKVSSSVHEDNLAKKTPTDWETFSLFDDDDSSYDDNPFENENPFENDSPTETKLKARPSSPDDNLTKTTPDNWKDTSSFHDDNLTKTAPAKWKDIPSFHDDIATEVAPAENWKIPPLTDDKKLSKPTSTNPKAPSHNDDSLKAIPTYTPYLQLPHLLSLTWLAYPIISLIFVAFRLQLSLASAENGLDAARNDILSSCNAAQRAATGTASLPRYLALASNQQFADAANGTMEAARASLILALEVLETTLNFIIDFYRSTLLCFIGLAIEGGFSLVSGAVQALSTFVKGISSNIESEVTSAESALTTVVNAINKADPVHPLSLPSISTADLNSLQNLTIPASFQQSLTSLNSSIPNPADIKSIIDDLVDTPFELLKKSINDTFNGLIFDPDLFPVPGENELSFCNDLNLSAIDRIKGDLIKTARIGSLVLIGLALLFMGFNCLMVWLRWRSMKTHLNRTREAWRSTPISDPVESSGSERQIDVHSRSFPSTPQNFTLSEKHTSFLGSEPGTDRNIRSFPSTPQDFTPSEKRANLVGSGPRMDGNTRSFPFTPQNFTPSEKHPNFLGSEPRMDGRTRSFPSPPQNPPFSEKHTNSPESEPQIEVQTPSFPSTPPNFTVNENYTKFFGSEPRMDGNTKSFPSAPLKTPFSDPSLKHTESGSKHQMDVHTRSSPSAPLVPLSDHNLLMLQADSEHPFVTRLTNFLAARIGMTPSQNIDMRWFFQYVFHPPALACFLIGFFGLLSVMIQLLILGPLLSAARAGVEAVVSDFSGNIAHSINQSMYNQSAAYANNVNGKVDVVQSAINNGLFGWVNGTTNLLSTNLENFYTEVQNLVSHVFNGTILEDPALGFVQCLIGNKVQDIEEALTFLQNNLFITLPLLSLDVLVLSGDFVNEVTAPIASAAVGNGGSGSQGLIGGAVDLYADSLRSEAIVFSIFMGIWGIVLGMAICVLLWRSHKRKKAASAAAKRQIQTLNLQEHIGTETFPPSEDEKEDFWAE